MENDEFKIENVKDEKCPKNLKKVCVWKDDTSYIGVTNDGQLYNWVPNKLLCHSVL